MGAFMRSQSDSRALRVLVVEDDLAVQANLRDILEMDDYDVELATSACEVVARKDLTDFGAILLDRKLPDGNGHDLLPYIRDVAPETAVILVTGYADLEGTVAAVRYGAADFLLKPIELDVLRSRLSRISDQRRMREKLAEAQRKLVQSERLAAIGQTIAVLSHEARNELCGLKMGLSLLPQILDDRDEALEIIECMSENEERLHRLFEDVRSFAAPIQLEPAVCGVGEIWRKAWSSLRPIWKNRDVSFDEEFGDVNLTLPADAFRLQQVFRNLFENSLAACADPVVISVACSSAIGEEPSILLTVRDNGPGLTREQEQKVFDAFFTTKATGTGLGMSIVKRIIEAHGGTINVGREAIQGAEFVITLPIGRGCPAAVEPSRPEVSRVPTVDAIRERSA